MSIHKKNGFTLIEIVLAAGMISVFFVGIAGYYKKLLDVSEDTTRHIQSGFLTEEGLEAIKMLRDAGWTPYIDALSTSTTYYLYWNGTRWEATTTRQIIENYFTRSFRLVDVKRDVSDNISDLGTYATGTKKVIVDVAWQRKGSRATATDTAETYISNLFSN